MEEFPPTATINLKGMNLVKANPRSGQQRFGLKNATTEILLSSTIPITQGWLKALHGRMETIMKDFSLVSQK